jgi:hypothetical protein
MNRIGMLLSALLLPGITWAGGITVLKSTGDVKVRQGVTEVWNSVASGDELRPHDTMRTGPGGSAVLVVHLDSDGIAKRIALPSQVIVDMSDIRTLTQEELMLKLTMEKVRASSYEWKNEDLHLPNAAVVHGENRGKQGEVTENDRQIGELLLNGARVLYDNGFYATTVLRALEVFRMYPALGGMFSYRLLLAQAMERASLRGEALAEYGSMLKMDGISVPQQQLVQGRLDALRGGKH